MLKPFAHLRRGFTLIELLVVMSILVILLTIALPVFNYITAARSAESGVNMIGAMLGRARTLALNRSDNKYVGVLFYNQPDDQRDAMQIVEVEGDDPSNALERYFSWQTASTYYSVSTDPLNPREQDAVYSQTTDSTLPAPFSGKPVIKRYTALQAAPPAGTNTGQQPPNGSVAFVDPYWNVNLTGNTIPVGLDSEAQFLPRGVRARVIKRNGGHLFDSPGIVLFDKLGHVAQRKWGIVKDADPSVDGGEKLLEAMGLIRQLPVIDRQLSAIGVAVYNESDIPAADLKDDDAVATWVENNADQLTVGSQSGELIGAK